MSIEYSNSYIDVYAKSLLNEIKNRVEQNRIKLINEEETDKKMIEVIKDLCHEKNNLLLRIISEDTERVICTLIIYYTAIYNDNLGLLNSLLENRFSFGYKRCDLNLYALDKRISIGFDEKEYINLLKNKNELFRSFYVSLRNYEYVDMDEDECIKEFVDILKVNPNIADIKKDNLYGDKIMVDLLTKKKIKDFGAKFILDTTYDQRRKVINLILDDLNENEIERLKNLMANHNFSLYMCGKIKEVLGHFTDEELLMISKYEKNLFREYTDKKTGEIDYEEIRNIIHNNKTKSKFKDEIMRRIRTFNK